MSKGHHNSAHLYNGRRTSRGTRLVSKLIKYGPPLIDSTKLTQILDNERRQFHKVTLKKGASMTLDDLKPGLVIQKGATAFKVSERYANQDGIVTQVSLQLVYPIPARTTVRMIPVSTLHEYKPVTSRMWNRYNAAWNARA